MPNYKDIIRYVNKLTDFLGEFPSFHDAEILEARLIRRPPTLEIKIYTFLTGSEIDNKGGYKRNKECIVTIKFSSIDSLQLEDFNQQNVIFGIDFEKKDKIVRVTIKPCYGFSAEFNCEGIEIVSVVAK
jgi:hypothetical protein